MLEAVQATDDLKEFLGLLFGEEPGFVYVATGNPKLDKEEKEYWKQYFFEWPIQEQQILEFLNKSAIELNTYIAPALFSAPNAHKEFVKGSHVVWVDFDNIPNDLHGAPSPSMVVESSNTTNKKQHWYWRLESFNTDIKDIERLNRGLAYLLDADISGWDANQVLRPPTTRNHKYGIPQQVSLLSLTPYSINSSAFSGLPEPPLVTTEFNVSDLQDVNLIIAGYSWTKQAFNLYRSLPENLTHIEGRSGALMQLAYFGAEMGMEDVEIFTLLYHADERWRKFRGRPDRIRRLNDIIAKARIKHPLNKGILQASQLQIFGFTDFLKTEIKIEWVVPNFLETSGQVLLSAKPGIGKSRFTLAFFIHMALGKPFLHYEITKARKLIYFSLEMGHAQLLYFLENMAQALTPDELKILQENLLVVPLGQALYLDKIAGQNLVEKTLAEHKPDGYCFDSLSRTTPETVNDEAKIKGILDWDAAMRTNSKMFSWYIHHNRKATIGNKKPRTLDDVLGATVIAANTSAAYTLWSNDPQNKVIDVICVKQRLAEMERSYVISGTKELMYVERSVLNDESFEVSAGDALGLGTDDSGKTILGHPRKPGSHSNYDLGF